MLAKRKITVEQARLKLAGLCARGEECEYDLRLKLNKWGISPGSADEIIAFLYENSFIDEERYAMAFARDKNKFNGWGRLKIKAAMRQKRLSGHAIRAGLDSIDSEEYFKILSRLVGVASKRHGLGDYESRAYLQRRMYARGFEPDLVAKAVNMIANGGTIE